MTRKRRLALLAVFVLIVFQAVVWSVAGRADLDDQVFLRVVREFVGAIRAGSASSPSPDYFYIGPELEHGLSAGTIIEIRMLLNGAGITPIYERDLTPHKTMPIEGGVSSRVSIGVLWNTPVLSAVEIADGYGPDVIAYGTSCKELDLYCFGKWIRLGEYGCQRLVP